MKKPILLIAVVLAGCGGRTEPFIIGETPAMISVCRPQDAPFNKAVALAQNRCRAAGKNAELIPSSPPCSAPDLFPHGWTHTFRCVAP